MRPLPQKIWPERDAPRRRAGAVVRSLQIAALVGASGWALGCGGGNVTSVTTPPAPPPSPQSVVVTVSPGSASAVLGNTQSFTAAVTNTNDASVTWAVNGLPGGNASAGTVNANGVYTAPASLPTNGAAVQVTATSVADPTKSASATVTIVSDIAVGMTPNAAGVELGATQKFLATISSGGYPDTAVRWSLAGPACPSACGAVDANGNYTAPQVMPAAASVTLTAQSLADPSKQASASISIGADFTLQISAPSTVAPAGSVAIQATLTPPAGSSPNPALSWSLSGNGCSGTGCGTLASVTTQTAGGSSVADTATYTAPTAAPNPNTVTIVVTPQADPLKAVQATVTIQAVAGVSLAPQTATLAANHRVTLTATVNEAASAGVTWSVNGIAGGNAAVGQICIVGSSPCQPVTASTTNFGSSTARVDYVAPGAIPSPDPVTVQATSSADSMKSATAQMTVINHVVVSVLPGSATLAPLAVQGFTANVVGTSNQSVVWQIQGTACSVAAVCGSINTNGTYTAPAAVPTPDSVEIVAVSADDTTQSGAANVTISGGANILALHPASVYAGAADGFTLRVDGSGFAASSPGPGATILIGGTARTTTCSSAMECTAPVTASDVAITGSVAVLVQSPSGAQSNTAMLVVVAPNTSDDVISLTTGAPAATGKDIAVVEPTTAGVSISGDDVDLNVAALGTFSTANNSCSLEGNPVALRRPESGTGTADICIFSQSGLDSSMKYTISGTGDVAVIAQQPAGLGIIHLTLQIPTTAVPGARTLFIQNTNLDKTAASGALEVD